MGRHSCCTKQKLRKGLWSPEEDEKLFNYISRFGVGCWSSVPKLAGLQRCGKSCRLRWINYLRPDLKRGMFSQQEEDLIINLHKALGNRWAQIAAQLPGRTDNEIKNLWNSSLKKKLIKQGIDPTTHQPLKHQLSPGSKNDSVSSSDDTNNGLPLKSQQPIFLDTFALANDEQFMHHYGASQFTSRPPQQPPFEPRFEPVGSDSDRGVFASQDHGFGVPCLASVDQSVGFDLDSKGEFSSSSYGSISSNVNMGEMNSTSGFSEWDHAKLESLFQYDDLDEFEDRKPENPWQMEGMIGLEDEQQLSSGYPLKFIPEELGSTNFDVFQQLQEEN